jgi:hypothetical protein
VRSRRSLQRVNYTPQMIDQEAPDDTPFTADPANDNQEESADEGSQDVEEPTLTAVKGRGKKAAATGKKATTKAAPKNTTPKNTAPKKAASKNTAPKKAASKKDAEDEDAEYEVRKSTGRLTKPFDTLLTITGRTHWSHHCA